VPFAADYFEREIDVSDVARVYRHVLLTQALVKRLNPAVDFETLMEDITEIGYPETIEKLSPILSIALDRPHLL
jgi:hypothetical protein